jgi:predicted DNA-binding ribbon-helix-helix protein
MNIRTQSGIVGLDLSYYESRSHSLRINGSVTSVRLENVYWNILGEIAEASSMPVNDLIRHTHDEMTASRGSVTNITSLLRITCVIYLLGKTRQAIREGN